MERKSPDILLIIILISFLHPFTFMSAQENDPKPVKKGKEAKELQEHLSFTTIDSLISTRQFVFKADFSQGSNEIFVVVDSLYAMVQNGNRNNLEGQVRQCKVKKDEKRKTISITLMLRGAMSSADVFILVSASGQGTATVKSDFPGYFSFNGFIVDFENANIYAGGSHFVH
jgi:hypothetical protein